MQDSILPGIVLYKPDLTILRATLGSIAVISKRIVVVLNSICEHSVDVLIQDLNLEPIYVGDGTNLGIGYAHNEIMRVATELNYEFALICDQDTIIPNNIGDILTAFTIGDNVCAVAPAWATSMTKDGRLPIHSVWGNGRRIQAKAVKADFVQISHCISSGMIISTRYFDEIGPFRDDLFIDWVDNEWCWRANNLGFKIIGSGKVFLEHKMGDELVDLKLTKFTKRNRERNYYIIRNAFYLILYGNLFYSQKLYLFKKLVHHIIISLVLERNRLMQLKNYYHALTDGQKKELFLARNIK